MNQIPTGTPDYQLFENAFRFASIGMCLVSPEGNFLKVNKSLCELLGYTEQELLTLDFQAITHPEDLEADLFLLSELVSGKRESYSLEKRYYNRSGCTIWVMLSVSVIRNEKGTPRFFISQVQDFSALKITQQTLMNQSRMMALGEMSAGIAHEINNPLTVINLYATAIEQQCQEKKIDPETMIKFTGKINETVKRIGSIVMSLKRFARISDVDAIFEPARMALILNDSLELCREKFKSYDVNLDVIIEEDAEIECNPLEISQIIINLINNSFFAVKNLDKKSIVIKIQGYKDYVELSVTDSGPGIPIEQRIKIMEPFFTTKPVGEGSGLGLSISKSIVVQHGGEIFLDEKNPETKFVVRLPRKQNKKKRLSIAS